MTSSPVMSANLVATAAVSKGTLNTQKTDFADFKGIMGQARRKINDLTNDLHGQTVKPEVKDTTAKEVQNEVKMDDKAPEIRQVKTDGNTSETTVTDEQVDEVTDVIEEIKEVLKAEFNLTDEEIETVLANLGLNQMALLDTEAIPEIVAKISGAEDTLSLVTDEAAYESLSRVTEFVETNVKTIAEELNIPTEEVEEALKQFETVKTEETPVVDNTSDKDVEEIGKEEDAFESKLFVVNKDNSKKTVSFETKIESIEVTKEEVKEITTDLRKSGQFEQNGSQENSTMSFAENLFSKVAETLNEETGEMTAYTSYDAKNIMNQLTEFIKIDVSTENPEVSLRLHPETLGTVSVKISANNEGLLTAQFITQNESVKAVIESQAMVLRENLEAKGVAVEAVEVLVESHAFERNLSDQSKGGEAQNNNGFSRKTRRITLFDNDEEIQPDEIMSEADSLAKEMMIQNGNTVDYSV